MPASPAPCPRCPNCTLFATIDGVSQCVCCYAIAQFRAKANAR